MKEEKKEMTGKVDKDRFNFSNDSWDSDYKLIGTEIDFAHFLELDDDYDTFKFIDSEDYEIKTRELNVLKKFEINKIITLKLIRDDDFDRTYTRIFLNDQIFLQCAYVLMQNPHKHELQSKIDSIDEAAEKLDSRLEMPFENDTSIPPEEIFWAHCSNLQAWCEFNYDSRLLHSNLSFPLLRELYKLGDLQARKAFKEEIAVRLLSQYPP